MLLSLVFLPIYFKKGKTWFRGYGCCEFLNGCHNPFAKAKPRSDEIDSFGKVTWLCDSHYEETLRIRNWVNKVYESKRIVSTEEMKRFKESGHRE